MFPRENQNIEIVNDSSQRQEMPSVNEQIFPLSTGLSLSESIPSILSQPQLRVYCKSCMKSLSNVSCVITQQRYKCIGCFAKEISDGDIYTIISNTNEPIIESGWTTKQQLLLLHYLQLYGFGNWKEIKDNLEFHNCKFTEFQIESHYHNSYLTDQSFMPKFIDTCDKKVQTNYSKSKNQPISIASLTTKCEQNSHPFEEIDDFQINSSIKKGAILGFNSNRRQFDTEYDCNAEDLLAYLQFKDDDSQEEVIIKFKLIQQYNQRLSKREKVKNFVLQHRLLDFQYQNAMDLKRNQYQKLAFEELKPLARFNSLQEHNELVRKLGFAKQLQSLIEAFRKFRKSGKGKLRALPEWLKQINQEGNSKKRVHYDPSYKSAKSFEGKHLEEILKNNFGINKKDLENIIKSVPQNGQKLKYRDNLQAFLLQKKY